MFRDGPNDYFYQGKVSLVLFGFQFGSISEFRFSVRFGFQKINIFGFGLGCGLPKKQFFPQKSSSNLSMKRNDMYVGV